MQQRPYGASGLTVSALAYGAMTIAMDPGLKDGVSPSLLAALEGGITLIDTARVYPGSEAIIAATLKAWSGARPVISTKLAPLGRETWRAHRPLAQAYTPDSIRASVEGSLQALGVETLDIVHLHQWHYLWTHEPAWLETLVTLRAEGKLRCIAISAQDHEHDALLELVSQGRVDGVQAIVNLFESRPATGLLPLAAERGVGVIARCVYDSGGLTGLTREQFTARPFLKEAPYGEYHARLRALTAHFIPDTAADLAELALRFVLTLPGVSSATLGMGDVALVEAALAAAAKGPLPPEAVDAIRREHVWTKNFYERLP